MYKYYIIYRLILKDIYNKIKIIKYTHKHTVYVTFSIQILKIFLIEIKKNVIHKHIFLNFNQKGF